MKEKITLLLIISISILGCDKNALFSINIVNSLKQSNSSTSTTTTHPTNQTKIEPSLPDPPPTDPPPMPLTPDPIDSKPFVLIIRPETKETPRYSAPQSPRVIQKKSQHTFQDFFPYQQSQSSFYQPIYGKNKMTISFTAQDNKDFHIRDLQKEDIVITENQLEIQNYTLSSEKQRLDHQLDVVFAIDIGKSMARYGNVIEDHIKYFISVLEKYQLHANFCLVTFHDIVEKECNDRSHFNDNFRIEDISYNADGIREQKQNSLAGLLEAAEARWGAVNQHIIILITDAQPWIYLEYKSQNLPFEVPIYERILNALQGISVFTLTHDATWLSKEWSGLPSITQASSGQWFDLEKLQNKAINIGSILNQIRDQWNILYKAEYIVESQQELNPFLSLEERQIFLDSHRLGPDLQLEDVRINIQDVHSNMPDGNTKPQYSWVINKDKYIHPDNIFVTINGIPESNFFIRDGEIIFIEPPPEGSRIDIHYELGDLIDNIQRHPLALKSEQKHHTSSLTDVNISNFSLHLNGKEASPSDFEIKITDNGNFNLYLRDSVFNNEDPYDIRQSNGLDILFSYEILSQHKISATSQ